MTTQEQDKNWNDLGEETREAYREKYKFHLADSKRDIKCNDGGYDLSILRSQTIVKELENMFGSHNLNPQPLTYEDVAMKMYSEERTGTTSVEFPTFSDVQADKLSAIHQLITVAKYLNGDWKPDWENDKEEKYHISLKRGKIIISYLLWDNSCIVYFRTKELAEQAIQILGEETIRLALSCDF